MAVLTPATFSLTRTGGAGIGYREDLSKSALQNLDPHDAYFTKKSARVDGRALDHDWLTDNLPTLSGLPTPATLVDEPTYATTVARKRFFNTMQYFNWPWKIAQASEIIAGKGGIGGGITSEIANEIERQMKFGGKQMELVYLSAQAYVNDNGAATGGGGTPGKMSGFFDVAKWNANSGGTPPLAWNAALQADQASFDGLNQSALETLLLAMYRNGAVGPITAYMPSTTQATWAQTFQGRPGYRVNQDVGAHAIDNQVHTFWSSTGIGQVDFVADRTLDSSACVALINHDYIAIADLSPISVYENDPNNFRNRQGWIDTYTTLVDKNPQGHGRIYTTGVTPS